MLVLKRRADRKIHRIDGGSDNKDAVRQDKFFQQAQFLAIALRVVHMVFEMVDGHHLLISRDLSRQRFLPRPCRDDLPEVYKVESRPSEQLAFPGVRHPQYECVFINVAQVFDLRARGTRR